MILKLLKLTLLQLILCCTALAAEVNHLTYDIDKLEIDFSLALLPHDKNYEALDSLEWKGKDEFKIQDLGKGVLIRFYVESDIPRNMVVSPLGGTLKIVGRFV